MKILILFFSVVIVGVSGFAQKDRGKRAKDTVPNIVDYSDKLNVYLYTKTKVASFSFVNNLNNSYLTYAPNEQTNLGLGFNYKFLGIGIAFNFNSINNDDDIYGRTKRWDWQGNLYGKKSVIDITFHKYISYYIENPSEVFPDFKEGDPNYIRPDISNFGLGFSYFYIFNHKRFSYKAAFVNTAVQRKSAGSAFVGGAVFIESVSSDSSFFPTNSNFDHFPELVHVSSRAIGIKGGYAYSFVIKESFYVSLSLGMAFYGGKHLEKFYGGSKNSGGQIFMETQPRIAIGINRKKWFTGISAVSTVYTFNSSKDFANLSFDYQYGNVKMFLGMRINVHGKSKKKGN